jgi:hypothetical protein
MIRQILVNVVQKFLMLAVATVMVFSLATVVIHADEAACKAELQKTRSVNVFDIVNFGKFVPVIPEGCGSDGGKPIPMSLVLIPYVAVRGFGAIASLAFYFFTFMLTFNGVRWTFEGLNAGSRAIAKKSIINCLMALVVLFSGSFLIITVLKLLSVDIDVVSRQLFQ